MIHQKDMATASLGLNGRNYVFLKVRSDYSSLSPYFEFAASLSLWEEGSKERGYDTSLPVVGTYLAIKERPAVSYIAPVFMGDEDGCATVGDFTETDMFSKEEISELVEYAINVKREREVQMLTESVEHLLEKEEETVHGKDL